MARARKPEGLGCQCHMQTPPKRGRPLTPIVNLNLNGGPSKNAAQLSSLPVASRYGRLCLMSTLLMTLLCPVISPTEEPLSHRKTAPNLYPKRGVTRRKQSTLGTVDERWAAMCQCSEGGGGALVAALHAHVLKEQTLEARWLQLRVLFVKDSETKCLGEGTRGLRLYGPGQQVSHVEGPLKTSAGEQLCGLSVS